MTECGLDSERFGAFAVPDYCLRLGKKGIRTVYNPWAVCVSPEINMPRTSGDAYKNFREKHADLFGKDPYYPKYV